jgi:hypothetical protein
MTADELPLWIAGWELDPWGDYRSDVRHAINAAYLGAVWGGKAQASDLIPI